MPINERLDKNIDYFAGKYRVRVKTKQGEIREYCDNEKEARRILSRIRKRHPPRIESGILQVAHRGTSHPRTGISRRMQVDRRKPSQPKYLVFSVSWQDETGRNRNTTFQAGNIESITPADERHAERSAIAFREAYEYARLNNKKFHPEAFSAWRTLQCYPWTGISEWKQTASAQVRDNAELVDPLSKAAIEAFLSGPIKND